MAKEAARIAEEARSGKKPAQENAAQEEPKPEQETQRENEQEK